MAVSYERGTPASEGGGASASAASANSETPDSGGAPVKGLALGATRLGEAPATTSEATGISDSSRDKGLLPLPYLGSVAVAVEAPGTDGEEGGSNAPPTASSVGSM